MLLGNGDGTFQPKTDFPTGSIPIAGVSADFNEDTKADLAIVNNGGSGAGGDSVSILLGDGAGGFGAKSDFSVANSPQEIASADFDGDGNLDLATSNDSGTGNVSVLLGNGDGTFDAKVDFATGEGPYGLVAADFDEDNDPDLATANYFDAGQTLSILIGDGDGGFAPKVDIPVGGDSFSDDPYQLASGDLNGDGFADLVASFIDADSVTVLLGTGTGGFSPKVDYPVGNVPYGVDIADFDGDSKQDIVTSNGFAGTVSLLRGTGTGTFAAKTDFPTGAFPSEILALDFNADNRVDIATTRSGDTDGISIL